MAGLDSKFTPHSARATFATMLDRMGEPLQNIQNLLGHANPSTTQTYTHRTVDYQDSPVFRASYGKEAKGPEKN
jgi:site-specific recombinase XerD